MLAIAQETIRMAQKAPGRSYRKGLTVIQLLKMFPDDDAAEKWFEDQRWSEGRFCPHCGSTNTREEKNRKPMPYRCRDCRGHFSVKHGTTMQSSKVGLQKWAIALYMMTTGIKGTSSMKIYRELGIRQATAWFLMQRIREGFDKGDGVQLPDPVEVDESYFGGKEKNKHKGKKLRAGRGAVGKTAVAGARHRESNTIRAEVVSKTDNSTPQGFVANHVAEGAKVYTDEASAYKGMPFEHESVNHSVGEYVDGMAHTNGLESFWALLKRGYHGTFHRLSAQHLQRYVREFAGRHNIRDLDTVAQVTVLARGMVGKRLKYRELVGNSGAGQ